MYAVPSQVVQLEAPAAVTAARKLPPWQPTSDAAAAAVQGVAVTGLSGQGSEGDPGCSKSLFGGMAAGAAAVAVAGLAVAMSYMSVSS